MNGDRNVSRPTHYAVAKLQVHAADDFNLDLPENDRERSALTALVTHCEFQMSLEGLTRYFISNAMNRFEYALSPGYFEIINFRNRDVTKASAIIRAEVTAELAKAKAHIDGAMSENAKRETEALKVFNYKGNSEEKVNELVKRQLGLDSFVMLQQYLVNPQ